MLDSIKVVGAGLGGLSAAINLRLAGFDVTVYELNSSPGQQIKPNLQGLRADGMSVGDYLRGINLEPEGYYTRDVHQLQVLLRRREMLLNLSGPIHYVMRGGERSLEYGLYRQAEKLGVGFQFNSTLPPEEAGVLACGSRSYDVVAYGRVYEGVDYPAGRSFIMFDDDYSPRGWYMYGLGLGGGKVEVINCVSRPQTPKVKRLYEKAVAERPYLRQYFHGRDVAYEVAGYGAAAVPNTAVRGRTLLVGEVAGFQDVFMGFGMNYALESGQLAAQAIARGQDYNRLWKGRFRKSLDTSMAKRFVMALLGGWVVERVHRSLKDNDTFDYAKITPDNFLTGALTAVLSRMERVKKRVVGHW